MAYVSAKLNLMVAAPGGLTRWWSYLAGADAQAAVRVANYFSDAYAKGARTGDLIFVTYDSGAGSVHVVNSATSAAFDVTDGQAIAATDTD